MKSTPLLTLKNDMLRNTVVILIVNFLKLLYESRGVLVAYATTNRVLEARKLKHGN